MSPIEKREPKETAPNKLQINLDSLRNDLKIAPVMAFLEKFDNFIAKKKKVLTK